MNDSPIQPTDFHTNEFRSPKHSDEIAIVQFPCETEVNQLDAGYRRLLSQ